MPPSSRSRGRLASAGDSFHHYFGTKERLLIQVLRSDIETRLGLLEQPLAAAKTADEVVGVLVSGAEAVLESDPGFYVILYELFSAGRQNAEIKAELAELYQHYRRAARGGSSAKGGRGGAQPCATTPRRSSPTCSPRPTAGALQRLTDPDRDFAPLRSTVRGPAFSAP